MAKTWSDLGNGQWKLVVTSDNPDDKLPPSVYYGSKDEITDKLADSKVHGDRRIQELRQSQPPTPPKPQPGTPRPLTQAERMQTVADLANPATVDKAVSRVIESVMGPVEAMRQEQRESQEERETRDAIQAAKTFADGTPDWYPSEHNKNVLMRYMETHAWSASNPARYTQAFEELSAAGLLQPRPQESDENAPEQRHERTAPAPAATPANPTRISTGVRQRDISGTAPKPTPRFKYTREQIAQMSAGTYKQKMLSDPEFSRCVEYYAQQDRRRRTG